MSSPQPTRSLIVVDKPQLLPRELLVIPYARCRSPEHEERITVDDERRRRAQDGGTATKSGPKRRCVGTSGGCSSSSSRRPRPRPQGTKKLLVCSNPGLRPLLHRRLALTHYPRRAREVERIAAEADNADDARWRYRAEDRRVKMAIHPACRDSSDRRTRKCKTSDGHGSPRRSSPSTIHALSFAPPSPAIRPSPARPPAPRHTNREDAPRMRVQTRGRAQVTSTAGGGFRRQTLYGVPASLPPAPPRAELHACAEGTVRRGRRALPCRRGANIKPYRLDSDQPGAAARWRVHMHRQTSRIRPASASTSRARRVACIQVQLGPGRAQADTHRPIRSLRLHPGPATRPSRRRTDGISASCSSSARRAPSVRHRVARHRLRGGAQTQRARISSPNNRHRSAGAAIRERVQGIHRRITAPSAPRAHPRPGADVQRAVHLWPPARGMRYTVRALSSSYAPHGTIRHRSHVRVVLPAPASRAGGGHVSTAAASPAAATWSSDTSPARNVGARRSGGRRGAYLQQRGEGVRLPAWIVATSSAGAAKALHSVRKRFKFFRDLHASSLKGQACGGVERRWSKARVAQISHRCLEQASRIRCSDERRGWM
ncbi:hypothetical protein FB451DRAFT_1185309 [Mycena latifolia]|nr:hypothetical protein FB451DRAFT_1185309 [Mycena latifolia]